MDTVLVVVMAMVFSVWVGGMHTKRPMVYMYVGMGIALVLCAVVVGASMGMDLSFIAAAEGMQGQQ